MGHFGRFHYFWRVGVNIEETFAQLLQNKFNYTKIWNTAVIGYSLYNYKDVIDSFLEKRDDIKKVLLFNSLNDVYGNITVVPRNTTIKGKIFFALKRYSKLYMLLKNTFFDKSRDHALYDINMYSSNNPYLNSYLEIFADIDTKLKKRNIEFIVIILPYEYQLRMKEEKYLKPQKVLSKFLFERNIQFIDGYNYFDHRIDSKHYFLYADSQHLSKYGHKIVFELVYNALRH